MAPAGDKVSMSTTTHMAILGGGPAGLAAGYYASRRNIPFTVFEASPRIGGNCITLRHGDFLMDSGAHRLHDQDSEATREIQSLLGSELLKIDAPSLIYSEGKFIDFPLSPLNLARALGPLQFARAGMDVVRARLGTTHQGQNFESFAIRTYGKTLADRFLLRYSEKLWGAPCRSLSPRIAGKRMKGLTLKTFLKEALSGGKAKTEHLDGSFYYPRHGIGMIPDALAAACGESNVRRNAAVTGISHNGSHITAVEINGGQRIETGHVVSTLPLDRFVDMLTPRLPDDLRALAAQLRYRHVVLVALFLDRPSVNTAATLYFPGGEFPFTRLYEPRNRSVCMSPPGKTSLVIEVPCQEDDAVWTMPDQQLVAKVSAPLLRTGLITASDITDSRIARMPRAYPVLETGFDEKLDRLMQALSMFGNLSFSGRCGRFAYAHLHDLMRWGREIVEKGSLPPCAAGAVFPG